MRQKAQWTVATGFGLVLLLVALVLPWLGLERYRGDTRFVLLSVCLFAIAGGLYFWAVRPDLLRIYWIVVAAVALLGALWVHWLFQGCV